MDKAECSVLTTLKKWAYQGEKKLSNGTTLICSVPHVAPEAWLHIMYGGLSQEKIDFLERELGLQIPSDFATFLSYTNGSHVFSDSINIWGLKESYSRTKCHIFQPYDLIDLNMELRKRVPANWLVFGSYSWDGSLMAYVGEGNLKKVYRCDRDTFEIFQEWSDLFEWLYQEVGRLSLLFDENGVEYDENTPTIPS